jgi:hypothetical protein
MNPSDAISALIARGETEASIASAVGSSQPTINRIRHGQTPAYPLGRSLVELAKKTKPRKKRRAA